MARLRLPASILCLALLTVACGGARGSQAAAAPTRVVIAQPTPPFNAPADCPVTQPPDPPFVPLAPHASPPPVAGQFWYGTADLWTLLRDDGTSRGQLSDHGDYTQKLVWWRQGFDGRTEEQPALVITGRRLDADAPTFSTPPRATNGYHPDFDWFMLAGVGIPILGCWEITGHYREQTLSYVVRVTS